MAQEFASDNSKTGLFSRLKLSNHRGFFSFLFVTLSVIFILVTFSAIQQQQTTQSKASETNLCQKVNCSAIKIEGSNMAEIANQGYKCNSIPCCKIKITEQEVLVKATCENTPNAVFTCTDLPSQVLCTALGWNPYCEWKNNKCGDKGSTQPQVTCDSCTAVGQGCSVTGSIPCSGFTCSPTSVGSTVGICKSTTTTTTTTGGGTGGGDPDSACTSLAGRCLTGQTGRDGKDCKAVDGQAGTGKIQSGLCSGGADRKCCVPNSTGGGTGPTVTCGDITTQEACLPANQCTWITKRGTTDTKICQRVCGRIPDQPTCDKRNDCQWKNNQCVNKSGSGPSGNVGDVDLNLELAFQGIVTLPKTKTELKVKVKLVDAENREKENDVSTFTADANGIWSGKVTFSDVDLGQKYYILIKGPMHVQKKICSADAADPNPGYYSCQFGNITLTTGVNTFDFSKVKMLVGDLDQNGLVNREDTGPLLSALLLDLDQRKSTEILEKLDLNLDGIVEPKDWSLMLEALKIKYDEK